MRSVGFGAVALIALIALVACRDRPKPPSAPIAPAVVTLRRSDPPAVHGMALFGESTVFASHLPMFHPPHDYQVLLQIALVPDARVAPGELHTIAPKPFELARAGTVGFEMVGDVFRGHFERGGTSLGEATARVERVIRFEQLSAATPAPLEPHFILFGSPKEAYLVHVITSKPDFDQIVRVTVPATIDFTDAIDVRVPKRSPTKELDVGETIPALAGDLPIAIHVDAQIYLERDDLAM